MGEQETPEEVKQMGVVAVILKKADMTPRQVANWLNSNWRPKLLA